MPSARFYAGLFLVTLATLALQLIQSRILSVVSWYHLGFFVISLAMFGLTAGAVYVYLRGDRFTQQTLSFDLAYYSAAFAVAAALSLAVQMTLAPGQVFSITSLIVWGELALCLSAPFFFSGVVVSLALTRSPFPIGRVYGFDLLGAAAGCLGVLYVLDHTNGPAAVLWAGATGAAGAMLFAGSGLGHAPARPPAFARLLGRRGAILAVLVAAALLNGWTHHGIQPLVVANKVEERDSSFLFEGWNSFSRVAVFAEHGSRGPRVWGPSPRLRPDDWPIEQRYLHIDGNAGTPMYRFDGDPSTMEFLRYDVTNLAYFLPGRQSAAIIGVGGGRDVLSAWLFGLREIVGVEMNPIFIELLTRHPRFADYAGLAKLDGIRFDVDEARSWFARTDQRFDVVQMSMIDTWAATGAGAYTLSENGLYTTEAWKVFLDRLTPDGVFTVSRWYAEGEVNETGRMISLAVASLLERGVSEPARHIFLAATTNVATLVLSPSPLREPDLAALRKAAAEYEYKILLDPQGEAASEVLRRIVTAKRLDELVRYTASLPLDLTPPSDERPFFFNQLPFYRPDKIFKTAIASRPDGVVRGNLDAAATLLAILVVSATLVAATIVIPLRPALRHVGRALVVGGTAYFLLIGFGFMMVEIGLLQRMGVFLGHPIYSLSVVLFSLILTTGLGSMASDRWPLDGRGRFAIWSVLTGVYLLAIPAWLPGAIHASEQASLLVRGGLCVATIAPAGFLMGFGFPTGMRLVSAIDRRPTPWFWGVNGAAGVLAAIVAVACNIALGISATLMIGGACYLLLNFAASAIGFRAAADAARPDAAASASR